MTFKSLFSPRKVSPAGTSGDAGMIVILMMALVFVPIVAAHAASMWHGELGTQQLAGVFNVLLRAF